MKFFIQHHHQVKICPVYDQNTYKSNDILITSSCTLCLVLLAVVMVLPDALNRQNGEYYLLNIIKLAL